MAGRRRSILALCLLASCFVPHFSAIGSETVTYSYDARGRLIQVSRSGDVNDGVQASYSYDKADNRTNVAVTGAPPSTPTFSIDSASAIEGTAIVFTVSKSGTASGTLTVDYTLSSGTATSGTDFNSTPGSLTFLAGDTQKPISVPTTDDASVESSESFTVTLSNASAGSTIGTATGTGTINDNDSASTCGGLSFSIASNAAVTEGTNSVFTVTKAGSTTNSCSINYATANGSATAGSDYTAASGTLTFTSAQASRTVSVLTTDDAAVESAETFAMALSAPTGGATVGTPGTATATLNDNDSAATCSGVSFSVVNNPSAIEGDLLVFTVSKGGSTTSSCSVNYATANGTAVAPGDYVAANGTLTFTSAQTSKQVSITTNPNGLNPEPDEVMYLNLSAPTGGATIADSQGVGTISDDGQCQTCLQSVDPAAEPQSEPASEPVPASQEPPPEPGLALESKQ